MLQHKNQSFMITHIKDVQQVADWISAVQCELKQCDLSGEVDVEMQFK